MPIDLTELLTLRLGLDTGRPRTRQAVAKLLKVSVAAVTKAEAVALRAVETAKKTEAAGAGTGVPTTSTALHRMMTIHARLQKQFTRPHDEAHRVTAPKMARLFETDEKTIRLDLQRMKGPPYHLPIEYSQTDRTFRYTREVTEFMGGEFTPDELVALVAARQAMEVFKGAPFAELLREVFARITVRLVGEAALLGQSDLSQLISVHTAGAGIVNPKVFRAITTGLLESKLVEISYVSKEADKPKRRKIEPHHLECVNSQWYVVAHDSASNAFRTFALSRIREDDVVVTWESFTRRPEFRLADYVGTSFGAQTGKDSITVKVRVARPGAHFVRERDWPNMIEKRPLDDGGVEATFRVSDLGDIERWILAFGSDCVVLEPASLKVRIKAEAQRMLETWIARPGGDCATR